jgi:ubiquinol-cytochrome c reductase subunit 6
MGIADFFSDLYSSMGFPEAHADAPPEDKEDGDSKESGDDDKADGEGDEKAEGGDEEAGGDEEGGEEEPEEEEEEEPVDAKPKLEEGEFDWAIYFQFRFKSG